MHQWNMTNSSKMFLNGQKLLRYFFFMFAFSAAFRAFASFRFYSIACSRNWLRWIEERFPNTLSGSASRLKCFQRFLSGGGGGLLTLSPARFPQRAGWPLLTHRASSTWTLPSLVVKAIGGGSFDLGFAAFH
jgi:hypothetical protein